MNWIGQGADSFDEALGLQPALQQKYRAFLDAVDNAKQVPVDVLALCRQRIAFIHGITAEDATASDEAQAAALAVADRIPYQHHALTDEEVDAVKAAFGDAGCVALLTALAFYDVRCRLELTLKGAP